jgi:hypothetical protein
MNAVPVFAIVKFCPCPLAVTITRPDGPRVTEPVTLPKPELLASTV